MSAPAPQADWAACARAISAQGAVGLVHQHATHHVSVETSLGRIYGRDDWAAALLAERTGFTSEDVPLAGAWLGASAPGQALVIELDWKVAHTDLSPTFGPATGRTGVLSSAMIGLVEGERVHRAWRFVDHAAVARSLGVDLDARAHALAAGTPRRGGVPWEFGEVRADLAQMAPPASYPPPPGLASEHAASCGQLQASWNQRRFDQVLSLYSPGASVACGAESIDAGSSRHPWARILAACPHAVLFLELAVTDASAGAGHDARVALLWRWIGTHTGPGLGPPCGHRLHVSGVSVLHLRAGRIARERVVWDELGVRRDAVLRMQPDFTRP